MMRWLLAPLVALSTLAVSGEAEAARRRGVGLGVGAGVAVLNSTEDIQLSPAFGWGFFTDIPIISAFHITPSTIVYRVDPSGAPSATGESATDVSLNFKFVVPIGPVDLFAGVTAGITSRSDLDPHVGVLAGVSVNLVSNLDVFVNANYRYVIGDVGNLNNVQVYAGPLIRFDLGE